MKASRISDAQKAFILKQAEEGVPIGDVCRKAGISQATFYSWRKKYAGMTPPEMRRLKALEDENARLKKLVAELWAHLHGVTLDFSPPGKPTDNAVIEAFNGKLRQECLSAHWFRTGSQTRHELKMKPGHPMGQTTFQSRSALIGCMIAQDRRGNDLSLAMKRPIYVAGGFGGAAADLGVLLGLSSVRTGAIPVSLESHLEPDEKQWLLDISDRLRPPPLTWLPVLPHEQVEFLRKKALGGEQWIWNGLTPEDNRRLFQSNNIREVAQLVLNGLLHCFTRD